jgi:putative flippase GtrA
MTGRGLTARFTRYSALSLITVPVGYALLLIARRFVPLNAGVLNLIVGTVLTPPSFLLYRKLVWPGGTGREVGRQLFSFWQTVMLGALASSVLIGAADHWLHANAVLIVLAGLTGQGLVFVGRFFWLDLVTFRRRHAERVRPD